MEVRPDESTLWRWLELAVAEGRLQRDGTGRSNSPFQYWLKESEERWKLKYADLDPLPPLEDIFPDPYKNLPPLLPPSIVKLLEKRKKRRG